MADFYQHGIITTMQKLGDREDNELDKELEKISQKRPIALLLPALVSEFESPAISGILAELKKVNYIRKVVLSLDRADEKQFKTVKKIMSALPCKVKVVWHDGPRIRKLYDELRRNEFKLERPGKGRSVWMTMGYILSDKDIYAIALHDTDILSYSRGMLSRLVYPVVHPALDFEFSKGYYARVKEKLYGRVTRLFYTPLIRALKRILNYNAFVDYLGNFRYALSGEFALISSLARGIRISPTWGLEVSLLNEVYRKTSINRICQVEISEIYDHKHQSLQKDSPDVGLIRMATEIAEALFRILSQDGIMMSQSFFRTLYMVYIEESRVAIEKYHSLSLLNGLKYDRHGEIEASEAFVHSLKVATEGFMADPVGLPMMSAWVRVTAALPDFSERFIEAVDLDNE